ncbi:unnamed protein product [Camellia sinensis]
MRGIEGTIIQSMWMNDIGIDTRKVHRLMCLELKKCIDKISQIFSSIESSRPGCQSGMKVLCALYLAMERANSLILHCSESSKLYLAITGYKILLRCEKIRNTLESCLSQIQNMVHPVMAAQLLLMKRGGNVIYAGPLGRHSHKLVEYFEAVTETTWWVGLSHGSAAFLLR